MRPRGMPRGKERWVVSMSLDVPADVDHEADTWRVADALMNHLEADPQLKGWTGSVDVRPWTEFDELV